MISLPIVKFGNFARHFFRGATSDNSLTIRTEFDLDVRRQPRWERFRRFVRIVIRIPAGTINETMSDRLANTDSNWWRSITQVPIAASLNKITTALCDCRGSHIAVGVAVGARMPGVVGHVWHVCASDSAENVIRTRNSGKHACAMFCPFYSQNFNQITCISRNWRKWLWWHQPGNRNHGDPANMDLLLAPLSGEICGLQFRRSWCLCQ